MSEMISTTGRIITAPIKPENGRPYQRFDRNDKQNIQDIAHCAALAFHKALIGIAELSVIEQSDNRLRFAKPVYTYYPVYHLFTSNMLLDKEHTIKFFLSNDNNNPKTITYEKDKEQLNNPSEEPDQWNLGRDLEQDLATQISHGDIKKYCRRLRKRQKRTLFTDVLFASFVDNSGHMEQCIPGLFEKLDYVRDRAIYRPTHVIYTDGGSAQTSFDIRKEIEGLPSSNELFGTAKAFIEAVCNEWKKNKQDILLVWFLYSLVNDDINCISETVKRLGYDWKILSQMGGNEYYKSVPSFLCQMMELFDQSDSLFFYQKYWEPVLDEIKENMHEIGRIL